jgi:hypothetical protein
MDTNYRQRFRFPAKSGCVSSQEELLALFDGDEMPGQAPLAKSGQLMSVGRNCSNADTRSNILSRSTLSQMRGKMVRI